LNMRKIKPPKLVIVAILTTITSVFWVFYSLYTILTSEPKLEVPEEILAPISPEFDVDVLNKLSERIFFEEDEVENIKRRLRALKSIIKIKQGEYDKEFKKEQIIALLNLLKNLKARFPGISRLERHSVLDQRTIPAEDNSDVLIRRRIDPGPQFPWEYVQNFWNHLA